jgi:2-oxo-4-hydroxy-4-carboxy-5-ureidoimidazoline decarboxylase
MTQRRYTISEINALPLFEYTRVIGPAFEHSPWIAEKAWTKRPFGSLEKLHDALCQSVRESSVQKQIDLICAHPDLVGRVVLTAESSQEQASAGLDNLTEKEIELFKKNNQAYREKFGFPFVICARLNKKDAILRGFEERLKNSREQEIKTALEEVFKIAQLRLEDLVV